jgi:hypothetical protein
MENQNKGGWLDDKVDDPEFMRLYAREEFIEGFLTYVENEMKRTKVSRAELARRMDCKRSNVTQMFRRTRNLTAATMVDITFHLKLKLKLIFNEWSQARTLEPVWWTTQAKHLLVHFTETGRREETAVRPPQRIRSIECAAETEWRTAGGRQTGEPTVSHEVLEYLAN